MHGGICGNASVGVNSVSILGDTHLVNSGDQEVIPIVHKVTEIVKGENSCISMEELAVRKIGF